MKILHVINTLATGGAELHLLSLCSELVNRGHSVSVVALRKKVSSARSLENNFKEAGVNTIVLNGKGGYRLWEFITNAWEIYKIIKTIDPDLVHTHLPRADVVAQISRLLRISQPILSSIHDKHSSSWKATWALPIVRKAWQRKKHVIAISDAVRCWLVNDCSISITKISLVHYGIDPDPFETIRKDMKQTKRDKPLIISVGRLEPRKGHERAIHIMEEVVKSVPNVKMIIIGHDPWGYGSTLQDLITSSGLKAQIKLAGFKSNVAEYMKSANLFLFTSYAEGFGLVSIEAMAASLPVVASDIPATREIIVDGETGFLINADEPKSSSKRVIELLLNDKKSRKMGERGHARVTQTFTIEKMVDKTIAVYEDVLGINK